MVDAVRANLPLLIALLGMVIAPLLLVWAWLFHKRRAAKKRADEMRRGNQVYKEWRHRKS